MSHNTQKLHNYISAAQSLRLSDLIATTANVSPRQVLRVMLAVRAIAEEFDLEPAVILKMPHSTDMPSPDEARQSVVVCNWLHKNDALTELLDEIELIELL